MIETQFGRIADALERLVVLMEKDVGAERSPPETVVELLEPAPKPAKKAPRKEPEVVEEPAPEPKPQPTELTLDALRKSLAPLDPAAGRALLEQFGVRKVSELQPEQYMDVLKAAKAAK